MLLKPSTGKHATQKEIKMQTTRSLSIGQKVVITRKATADKSQYSFAPVEEMFGESGYLLDLKGHDFTLADVLLETTGSIETVDAYFLDAVPEPHNAAA
ncbi:MAG: hypothetical protein H5U32_08260 [Pseudomonas balearica]|uniref:hypothetical protein n=1 Tax=Stutzerimonas balearica TaxID=74829 RepID=UPI0019A4912E|nr:hypothetical protein [Stutzerimonas balearica]MBC7199224.1 hypothetical protein [Stutzerimonas balearica]